MTEQLRLATHLTFEGRHTPQGPVARVTLPTTGETVEVSTDVLGLLAAFAEPRALVDVAHRFGAGDPAQENAIAEALAVFVRGGALVSEASPALPVIEPGPRLLAAAHGCGATLVRWVIDAHPHFACTPPLRMLEPFGKYLRQLTHNNGNRSLADMGIAVGTAARAVGDTVAMALEAHAALRNKPAWVFASREHDLHLELLVELFGAASRLLICTRHPLAMVHDQAQRFGREGWHGGLRLLSYLAEAPDPHLAFARYWRDVHARFRAFRRLGRAQCHVARHEDLLRAPDRECQAVFAFLGSTWQPALLTAAFGYTHVVALSGSESHALLKSDSLKPLPEPSWRGWSAELVGAVWDVVGEEATAWGYGREGWPT